MTQASKARRKAVGETSGLTPEEIAAMKETLAERKRGKTEGKADLLAKIAAMPKEDRALAERIHAIVTENAPQLQPRTWYGMPAWTDAEGKVVCFFQGASKFKARYATLGFNDAARLDEGNMWPTSFAVTRLTPAEEAKIAALVKRAAG